MSHLVHYTNYPVNGGLASTSLPGTQQLKTVQDCISILSCCENNNLLEAIGMEKKPEYRECHEDRESQKLVDRIEKQRASQEAARAEDNKRTLDDHARKVGS